eukprot:227107-Ditylum_brightwellii.AAC.1
MYCGKVESKCETSWAVGKCLECSTWSAIMLVQPGSKVRMETRPNWQSESTCQCKSAAVGPVELMLP